MEKFVITNPEKATITNEVTDKEKAEVARKQLLAEVAQRQKEFEITQKEGNILERIHSGDIERIEQLSGSANEVRLVKLKEGGWAVFKSRAGEKQDLRADAIEAGTYYLREEAAFYLDQIVGFGLVPPTSVREVANEVGSIQQFVADSKSSAELSFKERDALVPMELFKLWIFDYVLWSSDRHFYNFIARDGKVCAVDNGLSLSEEAPSRVALEYFNTPVPEEIKTRLAGLETYLDSTDEQGQSIANIIQERLSVSIGEKDAEKCIKRMRLIARTVREKGTVPTDFDGGVWKASRLKQIIKKK